MMDEIDVFAIWMTLCYVAFLVLMQLTKGE